MNSPARKTRRPLEGLKVLDLTHGVAGPYCTMVLGDLGCDIVKIEKPGRGDATRYMNVSERFHTDIPRVGGDYFLAINRNKRAITLELKSPEGRKICEELAQWADIVVQNFRRGVLEKFGLGYEQLAADNPGLIYATIYGYGADGPLADAPATDSVMQAFGGLMSINGDDGPPLRVGNMVSDMLAGSYLSQGVLAALLMLAESGRGQRVSVSLLDALVAFQTPPVTEYMMTGNLPARSGRNHPLIAPSGTYQVKDGFVTLVATQPLWSKFCQAIDMPELSHDARFATNDDRLANRGELQALIIPFFAGKTQADLLELTSLHDLICAPINDYDALFSHDQIVANDLVRTWSHPDLGSFKGVRNPVRYAEAEPRWGSSPILGEHTSEILAVDLGYSAAQISELQASGAIMS